MMDKTSEDGPIGGEAEIEKLESNKSSTTSGSGSAGGTSPQRDDSASVDEDTFDDLAELGVQPQHRWRKDARHSSSSGTGGVDASGRLSPTRLSDSSGPHRGRLSMPTTSKEMIEATYDAEIIQAISSDVEDSDYYTSGSEDEYSDSDTDAVAYLSDSDAVASGSFEEKSETATVTSVTTETKKKKKDKKKKKKDKKKKSSSKRSSAATRASKSNDASSQSTRTSEKSKKKKRKSSRTSLSSTATKQTIVEEQSAENNAQKEQILKLQNQLSEALQKVVTTTEEHIQDKNNFLKVSTELTGLKGQIAVLIKGRDDALETARSKETTIGEQETRIDKLEDAVERQLDLQEELETKLDRSEEEINKLLEEIEELEKQQLEASSEGGGASSSVAATSRVLQAEVDQLKSQLAEKEKQMEEYTTTIAELEKELEEGRTVNRLQVSDMEDTNILLQGKLKAEKLEVSRKLEQKDATIAELQKEIDNYKRTDDVQDLVAAREKLNETRIELDETRTARELAMEDFATVNSEKEDLLEKLDVITTQAASLRQENKELEAKANKSHLQVLEWTEKTYDWKSRAEAAEKKLKPPDGSEDTFDDPAKQGLFLQAIMDNKAAKQQRASTGANLRRSVKGWFGKVADDGGSSYDDEDSDAPVEQIRIQKLEDRNASLDDTVGQLRSEIVKLQSSHKEKLYALQKELEAMRGENEALKLKNSTLLEQLSN